MRAKKFFMFWLVVLAPLASAASPHPGRFAAVEQRAPAGPGEETLYLHVAPLRQSLYSSCGEAAIAMAYSYSHPASPLEEDTVINYASRQAYFTEHRPPYTTPTNMVSIGRHFARGVRSGSATVPGQGWAVLVTHLRVGDPVIIDVRARLYDGDSPAHFIIVTGVWFEPTRGSAMINYNDPLTGTRESARWWGDEGIWKAWHDNGDPGGSGWWMAIPGS
ncbi:MAG: hypothetical protein ACM3QS_00410 [Bacteroidota bacterium]